MKQLSLAIPFLSFLFLLHTSGFCQNTFIRVNQLGYLPGESKVALAFSDAPMQRNFQLKDAASGETIYTGECRPSPAPRWGAFEHYLELDFSAVQRTGRYLLEIDGVRSAVFPIGRQLYGGPAKDLLTFMRQQRCGYNPTLDLVCHQRDGRSMFGPMPDSTYVDASGGWHDAGDQLKYLITGSYATAHMLLAYELYPDGFADEFNALGQPGANGIPDVLDEAKWGLDWIHKLHPAPGQLIHQVADDRDHIGWKMPDEDRSDYGWGPNSYRVAYFATGEPQGAGKFKSKATGVANLAGRSAAAMALGARIWKEYDEAYAAQCLAAAKTLYQLGREKEGYQQGNSYGAPYRYTEDTWADDMEWGAAELYKSTGDPVYLAQAKNYALQAATTSWMPHDTADHYKYYPFINIGHFALYEVVEPAFRETLADFYKEGIEATLARGKNNAYQIGVPFIWCSNNLTTALITQIIFYERMTGDRQYHDFMLAQRDWLFGRNPWGTSMFTGIPRDGEYPLDVHTSVWVMTQRMIPGGLIDGPVYGKIYNSLLGLILTEPDEFAQLQNPYVVYHDDRGDYSTNEPTMDGTAGAVLLMAYFGNEAMKE